MIPKSMDFQDHTFQSESTNSGKDFSRTEYQILDTPEKNVVNISSPKPEMESSLDRSVNSHSMKSRNMISKLHINLLEEQPDCLNNSITDGDANCRTEFGGKTNFTDVRKSNDSSVFSTCSSVALQVPYPMVMDKKLLISCSLCKSPLGLPENKLILPCRLTSSSKAHLASLLNLTVRSPFANKPSIAVLITEVSSVNQRVFRRTLGGATGQGVWCEEDGCVYKTIFCPFCLKAGNILGAQILATDASNIQFLNKVSSYLNHKGLFTPV